MTFFGKISYLWVCMTHMDGPNNDHMYIDYNPRYAEDNLQVWDFLHYYSIFYKEKRVKKWLFWTLFGTCLVAKEVRPILCIWAIASSYLGLLWITFSARGNEKPLSCNLKTSNFDTFWPFSKKNQVTTHWPGRRWGTITIFG